MEQYKCKNCGKVGTKEDLRRHPCIEGRVVEHDDHTLLNTLLLLHVIGVFDPPVEAPSYESPPSIDPGGGEFSGGGASSSYDSGSSGSCGGGD